MGESPKVEARLGLLMQTALGLYMQDRHLQNEVVRYCYDYVLPIANQEGFAKVMAMRERGLRGI